MEHSLIAGKKILLLAPAFFGYEDKIKNKMAEMGAEVDSFNVRSVTKASEKALLKISPAFFDQKTEIYYRHIYSMVKKTKYDYVLIIKCDMPTEHVLQIYRKRFRNAKFCLHMWDSMENIPRIGNKLKYFDFISSFDRNDCRNHPEFYFRPLYYCDEYKKDINLDNCYDYDLCFIGTVHSDRWKILKELKKQAEERELSFFSYPYLQSRFIYRFYKWTKCEFKNTNIGEFRFDMLSSEDVAEKIDRSRVIIDIQHPRQKGLTIRTIETIGMNKKLITTNADIKNYDFYNPKNIQIIDRKKPMLAKKMDTSYEALEEKLRQKYSLESWIYGVLGLGT